MPENCAESGIRFKVTHNFAELSTCGLPKGEEMLLGNGKGVGFHGTCELWETPAQPAVATSSYPFQHFSKPLHPRLIRTKATEPW